MTLAGSSIALQISINWRRSNHRFTKPRQVSQNSCKAILLAQSQLKDAPKLPTVTREESAGSGTTQSGHVAGPPELQRRPSLCPLVFLGGSSLLKMGCTYPCDESMVQSLRTQTITTVDRRQVLDNQGPIWADDELRWHIYDLVTCAGQRAPPEAKGGPIVAIDPLMFDGWIFAGTDSCEGWFQQHCPSPATLVTVACIQAHWIPVVMVPHQQGLLVHTWDDRNSDHSLLEPVLAKIAECMGLGAHRTARLVRMFDMAGAYIAHMLLDSMLPVNPSEVVQLHQVLRQRFVDQSLQMLTCPKPWKWGNGLQQQAEHELAPLLVQHGIPADQAPNRAKAAIRAIGA